MAALDEVPVVLGRKAFCPKCHRLRHESTVGQRCPDTFCWTEGVKYIGVVLVAD